ncbi:transcription factor EGL1-like isoform X2 [Cornus florida]|uniref:transcription factor EGL1-like isoform X2 n=1 Tax=Cornus florida TaxID=4283 RepID=UPI00289981C0|nr:transcription factor EGL1-like isoform X2 [Cornus florida]
MATGHQNLKGVPENLRKQLAIAVRSIQWSYAIFWSISSRQPGVLEWGDGYYNGDIKTRKTVQAMEFNADQLGLQRSEQLRELYESLAAGETNTQVRRPSAALSPEDLTDTEWYYLVCMSFMFNIGQGLPGRTLANGKPIWLCNAQYADSKVFSRSLLAKSASIQTVVCFPFLGGVVELGVTDLVLEDPNLIQYIKTSFLEIPHPIVSKIPDYNPRNDRELVCANLDYDILDTNLDPVDCEEVKVCSPSNNSNGFLLNQPAEEESLMVEGLSGGGASQAKSCRLMDEEISNCVYNSMDSSDCISQTIASPYKIVSISKGETVNGGGSLPNLQEYNKVRLTSLDFLNENIHYQSVLSTLLKSSQQLILGPCFQNRNKESSFISWKKGLVGGQKRSCGTPQGILKKVLFEVARLHGGCLVESREGNGRRDEAQRPEVGETDKTHVLSERRRREKINERFLVLGSLVPSASKVDKVSVLDNTIEYLKELERRVEELESCKEDAELEAITRRKPQDTAERTCDSHGNNKTDNGKKPLINKRKACDIDEAGPEINRVLLNDSSTDNVAVSMVEEDVLTEIKCPWRECLLIKLVDAISNLHLDSHSVQSSNIDGILTMTIKSKFKRPTAASAGMISQALQRVIDQC